MLFFSLFILNTEFTSLFIFLIIQLLYYNILKQLVALTKNSMNNIFRSSIQDVVRRQQPFQCFICYEDFDSKTRFPMEVCSNQHIMCQQCVKSRAFKVKSKNRYVCGLCNQSIKIYEIRRSPFVLSVKQMIQSLIIRDQSGRQNYKKYIQKQQDLVSKLLEQNCQRCQQIQILKLQVQSYKQQVQKYKRIQKQQQEQLKQYKSKINVSNQQKQKQQNNSFSKNSIFNSSIFRATSSVFMGSPSSNNHKADNYYDNKQSSMLQSKIIKRSSDYHQKQQSVKKQPQPYKNDIFDLLFNSSSIGKHQDRQRQMQRKKEQQKQKSHSKDYSYNDYSQSNYVKKQQPLNNSRLLQSKKKQIPKQLMFLFQQVQQMKNNIQKDDQLSKSQIKTQLQQLQKHQKYLQKIAQQAYQDQDNQKNNYFNYSNQKNNKNKQFQYSPYSFENQFNQQPRKVVKEDVKIQEKQKQKRKEEEKKKNNNSANQWYGYETYYPDLL